MLTKLQTLRGELEHARQALAEEAATAGVGGVSVEMTGTPVCRSVRLPPERLPAGDASRLADLEILAVHPVVEASQALAAKRMSPPASDLPIP